MKKFLLIALIWSSSPCLFGAEKVQCQTGAYSKDSDPAGTNIRESPNGKILTAIPSDTVFSIIGYKDGWFEVTDFEYYVHDSPDIAFAKRMKHKISGEKATIPGLKGWIHRKHVDVHFGISSPIRVRKVPDEESILSFLLRYPNPEGPDEILECSGRYLKIKVKHRTGWIDQFCTNTLSNCV
ncbi:SH3 domain-containing protein [Turneriella parva]|uniref:SH3b domain-containing protein n=1 Tax=Turneriella parva (strain ATCC BAA-1111 / DSM 21527 / NCTC 11395 / H) TaxID=869212 RepID=I4BA49_TURPD|nr:SH3 domain-containing protein [Turneriella parva]AFM14156.1 hypothetical protein Turpa_3519 [Turneriella parva DSM 21527]